MNDRTFAREHTKRALSAILELMDEASTAEAAGDFDTMKAKDKMAGMGCTLTAGQILAEVTEEKPPGAPGFVAIVLEEQIKEMKEHGL